MHYYQFNVKEHALASYHLNNEEDLAFRRLKDMYHDTEKPIPLDTESVARRLRLETQWVLNVLKDFFFQEEDGWHIAEIDAEIARYQSNAAKNKANGAKGGRPKREKEPKENPVGYESHPTGNPKPLTNNQQPITNNQDIHIAKPTRAGHVCRLLREQCKMQSTSPTHPKLLEAIAAGATDDEFLEAGHDAVARGKPFGYAIGTVIGRLSDAKQVGNGSGAASPKNAPKHRKTESQKKWEEDCATRGAAGVSPSPF